MKLEAGNTHSTALILVLATLILVSLSACQTASPEPPPDCLNAEDIANIRAEHNLDSSAARRKYLADQFCVEAELTSMERSTTHADIRGDAEESWVWVVHFRGWSTTPEDE